MLRGPPRPRSRLLTVATLVAAALGSHTVHAGPPTGGSLTFSTGGASPLVFEADASLAGAVVDAGHVTLDAGFAFAGTLTAPLSPASLASIEVAITGNTGGSWSGSPLTGSSVRILGMASVRPLGESVLVLPISAGAGDTLAFGDGSLFVTIRRYPWTTGALAITGLGTGQGATVTTTGEVVTGAPGRVGLVSASRITSSLTDPMLHVQRLELEADVVPEPDRRLLVLAGASILAGAVAARGTWARGG